MKIISWNCNGSLRTKLNTILNEKADIYCFQECEFYDKWLHLVQDNFHMPLFIGDNKNKGIAILVSKKLQCQSANWNEFFCSEKYGNIKDKTMKYFLPIKINDRYTIINCWCHKNNSEHFAYKGQFWKYLVSNANNIDRNTIFIGDLNANVIWDDADCWWNMSDNNKILNGFKLYSAYHHKYKEKLGSETNYTFFLYRHLDRFYHIDYAYLNLNLFKDFKILNKEKYITLSDHIPILLEINIEGI